MRRVLLTVLVLLLAGCDDAPSYHANARDYLVAEGVSDTVIELLLMQAKLPAGDLEQLGKYNNEQVLHLVASNPGTPRALLTELARHRDPHVRIGVASNPYTPLELLEQLREPGHYSIVNAALVRNPRLTPALLQAMFEAGEATNPGFAANPNTPPEVLRTIAHDGEELDRVWLAGNPGLPEDVLQQLQRDPSDVVRERLANRLLQDDPDVALSGGRP